MYYGFTPRRQPKFRCDNKVVIRRATTREHKYGANAMMRPAYDIKVELKGVEELLRDTLNFEYLKGYQDDDVEHNELSRPVQLNVKKDKDVWQFLANPPERMELMTCSLHFPENKMLVMVAGKRVTKIERLRKTLTHAYNKASLRNYILSRNGWTMEIFESVDWDGMEAAKGAEVLGF